MSRTKEPGTSQLAWVACKAAARSAATRTGLGLAAKAVGKWAMGWIVPVVFLGALAMSVWLAWTALPWIGAVAWSSLPNSWTSQGEELRIVKSGKLAEPVWRSALISMGATSDDAAYFARIAGKRGPGEAALPTEEAKRLVAAGTASLAESLSRKEKAEADRDARAGIAWIKAMRSGATVAAAAQAAAQAEAAMEQEQSKLLAIEDGKLSLSNVALAVAALDAAKSMRYGKAELRLAMAPWFFASSGAASEAIRVASEGAMRFIGVLAVALMLLAVVPVAIFILWLVQCAEEAVERNREGLTAQWERGEVERSAGKSRKKSTCRRI